MLVHLRPALVMMALLTVLTGVVYPLAMTGLAQIVLPSAANGSILLRGNVAVGSALIGSSTGSTATGHSLTPVQAVLASGR